MAWALNSAGQGIVAAVVLMFWGCSEVVSFDVSTELATLLIAFGVGPLVWRTRSAVLCAVVLAAIYASLLFNAGEHGGERTVFVVALGLSVALVALSRSGSATGLTVRSLAVARFFGWTGALVCAGIMSFSEIAREFVRYERYDPSSDALMFVYQWSLTLVAVIAWGRIAWSHVRTRREPVALEEWFLPATLVFAQASLLAGRFAEPLSVSLVFNLMVLFTGAMWAVRGCREARLRPTVVGSLLIAALVFARYFDLFESLAARGATFVALGGAMFAEGFYFRRARAAATTEVPSS